MKWQRKLFPPFSPFPREWRPTISSARLLQLLSIVSRASLLRAKQPEKEGSSQVSSVNSLLEFSSMLIALDFSPTFLPTWPHDYLLTGSSTGASSRTGVPSTTEITWDQSLWNRQVPLAQKEGTSFHICCMDALKQRFTIIFSYWALYFVWCLIWKVFTENACQVRPGSRG